MVLDSEPHENIICLDDNNIRLETNYRVRAILKIGLFSEKHNSKMLLPLQ